MPPRALLAICILALGTVPAAAQVVPGMPAGQSQEQGQDGSLGQGAALAASSAAVTTDAAGLVDALGMDDLLQVMRDEGLKSGDDIAAEMFPDRATALWSKMVSQIYDPVRMKAEMTADLAARLSPEQIAAVTGYYRSDAGRRIVGLELAVRKAMLEPGVEDAARDLLFAARDDGAPRLAQIDALSAVLDLVENNVMGALNANYAFYAALNDAGLFDPPRTEEEMLAEVWQEEPQVREDSDLWVHSYLLMAYEPLSDDEVAAYTAFSASDDGQALNSALFAAFDTVFTDVSRQLGLAAAQFVAGEDL